MSERVQEGCDGASTQAGGQPLSVADRELIDGYLKRELHEAERHLVEARIVGDPDFRREVALTEALREGLHYLRQQGQLDPLLTDGRSIWQQPVVAIAACILAAVFCLVAFVFHVRLDRARQELQAVSTELALSSLTRVTATDVLYFASKRSADDAPDIFWRRPATSELLHLRFDVGLEPARSYRVVIEHIVDGGSVTVLIVPLVVTDVDGEVSITMHSAILEPGDYHIHLDPEPEAAAVWQSRIYTLHATGAH